MSSPLSLLLCLGCLLLLPALAHAAGDRPQDIFGPLRLIDEAIAGEERPRHQFTESEPGVSELREILGRTSRVIANTGEQARYVALRLGRDMGLRANAQYVLVVEYPEDQPRMMKIHNRGAETSRGLYTGNTVGDVLHGRYVDHNLESLEYPLSGRHEPFQMLFTLHDRYAGIKQPRGGSFPRDLVPDDGVPVIISQWRARNAPRSHGAAWSRVALYEVLEPEALELAINYPPGDLPRRHLFWREEMSNGLVGRDDPGWDDEINSYRAKADLMLFLGMNTYTIDMLEFGHNQGWDSGPGGGDDWVYQNASPQRWRNVLHMLRDEGYPFTMLPYYEYAGSVGQNSPGRRKYARPLGDIDAYTHVTWSERAYADVTEPIILEDAKKVIDLTINRFSDVMPFTGAWFRTRPSHIPVSFSDDALRRFADDEMDGDTVTREQLRRGGELYDRYIAWWQGQRKAFFEALRDHMRANGSEDAMILFTADSSEPGVRLRLPGRTVVTNDVQGWARVIEERSLDVRPVAFDRVVGERMHLDAQLLPHPTWGQWEWEHSVPRPDPDNYQDTPGIVHSYTFNRLYTVSDAESFDAFRTPAGLGIVRHYGLNENEMDEKLGYFVMDMDRTRAHMMHAEVVAMAHGDPWYIGYLAGHCFNRGFPGYARRFNQAFLALPALPSEVLPEASSHEQVIVRAIATAGHGTFLAVANTSMHPQPDVTVTLPVQGELFDAATGQPLETQGAELTLDMDAAELRALHIR